MSTTALETRTLTLARVERAAGEAFGFREEAAEVARAGLVTPTTVALATVATAIAVAITYLV